MAAFSRLRSPATPGEFYEATDTLDEANPVKQPTPSYHRVVLRRTYDDQVCSLARTLEVVGERWTLLIIRDALVGRRRFEEFHENLEIARNVLADRLHRLVEQGVFDRVRYQTRPDRFEYVLTARGSDLATAVVALMQWGDRHLAGPQGPPRLVEHECGSQIQAQLVCPDCQRPITADEVTARPSTAYERVS